MQGALKASYLSNILYSFVKFVRKAKEDGIEDFFRKDLPFKSPWINLKGTLEKMAQNGIRSLKESSTTDICEICNSLVTLGIKKPEFFEEAEKQLLKKGLADPDECLTIARAFSKAGYGATNPFYDQIRTVIIQNIEEIDLPDLGDIVRLLSKSEQMTDDFLEAIAKETRNRGNSREIDKTELVNTVIAIGDGYCKVGKKTESTKQTCEALFESVASKTVAEKAPNHQNMANLSLLYAKCKLLNPAFFEKLKGFLLSKPAAFESEILAAMIWAFTSLDLMDAPVFEVIRGYIFPEKGLSFMGLGNVLMTAASLGCDYSKIEHLFEHSDENAKTISFDAMNSIYHALLYYGIQNPKLIEKFPKLKARILEAIPVWKQNHPKPSKLHITIEAALKAKSILIATFEQEYCAFGYHLDMAAPAHNIAIEINGTWAHKYGKKLEAVRTAILSSWGWQIFTIEEADWNQCKTPEEKDQFIEKFRKLITEAVRKKPEQKVSK